MQLTVVNASKQYVRISLYV